MQSDRRTAEARCASIALHFLRSARFVPASHLTLLAHTCAHTDRDTQTETHRQRNTDRDTGDALHASCSSARSPSILRAEMLTDSRLATPLPGGLNTTAGAPLPHCPLLRSSQRYRYVLPHAPATARQESSGGRNEGSRYQTYVEIESETEGTKGMARALTPWSGQHMGGRCEDGGAVEQRGERREGRTSTM